MIIQTAKHIEFFFTPAAQKARGQSRYKFTLLVESATGDWYECGAVSMKIAKATAASWVDHGNVRGVSCRRVLTNGTLKKRVEFLLTPEESDG